jgi:hypothetical protein
MAVLPGLLLSRFATFVDILRFRMREIGTKRPLRPRPPHSSGHRGSGHREQATNRTPAEAGVRFRLLVNGQRVATFIGSPPRTRSVSIASPSTVWPGTEVSVRSRHIAASTIVASIMPRLLPTQNRGPAPNGM